MISTPQEWELTARYDYEIWGEAEVLVGQALGAIEDAYSVPAVHAKRQERARRLRRLGDKSMLVSIVAQWLSAKARAAAVPEAQATIEKVAALAMEVKSLQEQLEKLARALRYEITTEQGAAFADYSDIAAASLAEVLPELQFAGDAVRKMKPLAPTRARGRAGLVGALREAPPDDALARNVCQLWIACGLTTDGGEGGDGIDRFLESILGADTSKKALGKARATVKKKV
jgi:hypothetical protein